MFFVLVNHMDLKLREGRDERERPGARNDRRAQLL
jgi:hypothetical protein